MEAVLSNYIADNTYVEVPPNYFLQRVYDYDAMLVVMPSRLVPGAYVIARRRQFGVGITDKALIDSIDQQDTKMCLLNGVVPVCLMYKTGPSWDPDPIIRTLMARDTWAFGGGDAVADMLEAQEAEAEKKLKAEIRDDMYNRSGDAWRSYQARTGASTIKFHDRQPQKETAVEHTVSNVTAGWC